MDHEKIAACVLVVLLNALGAMTVKADGIGCFAFGVIAGFAVCYVIKCIPARKA